MSGEVAFPCRLIPLAVTPTYSMEVLSGRSSGLGNVHPSCNSRSLDFTEPEHGCPRAILILVGG